MKRTVLILLSILALVSIVAIACIISSPAKLPVERTSVASETATTYKEGIQLTIELDKSSYPAGESLNVTLRVTNRRDTPITLIFGSAQIFDFEIGSVDQSFSYRWSSHKAFAQVITEIKLEPGEFYERELPVDVNLQPGKYLIEGATARFVVAESSESLTLKVGPVEILIF